MCTGNKCAARSGMCISSSNLAQCFVIARHHNYLEEEEEEEEEEDAREEE